MKIEDTEALGRQSQQDQSPIQSTDLLELLVPLCTIITVNNTVNTETVFLIFPFLQTNITSQMWPSGDKGVYHVSELTEFKPLQCQNINRITNTVYHNMYHVTLLLFPTSIPSLTLPNCVETVKCIIKLFYHLVFPPFQFSHTTLCPYLCWPICWCCLDRGPGSFDVEDATTLSWSSAAVSE